MVKISVVVPTHNRRELLERCLNSLLAQTIHPLSYEIIVADDEANQLTEQFVKEISHKNSNSILRYIPVRGQNHGPAAARNFGWQRAHGQIIAFTDDDCIAHPEWLQQGLYAFSKGIEAAWGRIVMDLKERPTDYELSASQLANAEFVTANCFCIKDTLKEIGGFDERFKRAWREDSDLYFTLLERKKNIVYVPKAIVEHPIRPGRFAICLKQQKNNFYEALLFKKHPGLYSQKVSSLCMIFYYAAVISFMVWVISISLKSSAIIKISGLIWITLFVLFLYKRLRHTSKDPLHVLEMAFTSFLIPPLSIIWRLAGALHFKVAFL
jgi:glycosyltransferase involved in cell wall biosynthesis